MILRIKNENTTHFSINGLFRERNWMALVAGNNVQIVNSYYSKKVIHDEHFSNFEINGNIFSNVEDCANALTPIIFTKQLITSSGASVSTSNTLKFFNSTDGVVHQGITGNLFIDPTGQVVGGGVLVEWSGDGNPLIGGVAPNLIDNEGEDITVQGDYKIWIVWTGTKYSLNITGGDEYIGTEQGTGTGGAAPQAPSLELTEFTYTVGNPPQAPSLALTEFNY